LKRLILVVIGVLICAPVMLRADHKDLAVFADSALIEPGLMAFLLPRFSLKTGIGVHLEPLAAKVPGQGVVLQQADGVGLPVLAGPKGVYTVTQTNPDDPAANRFVGWLLSDIGQRTINQFKHAWGQLFSGAAQDEPAAPRASLTGDAGRGEGLAYANCGRCHVIGERNRMNGIGSTPSFALLRSFDDWRDRFQAFYALNPHPSFSQIVGATDPFDETLPPPISPLVLTQDELDDIVAFTSGIKPADLGAPLVHQ